MKKQLLFTVALILASFTTIAQNTWSTPVSFTAQDSNRPVIERILTEYLV